MTELEIGAPTPTGVIKAIQPGKPQIKGQALLIEEAGPGQAAGVPIQLFIVDHETVTLINKVAPEPIKVDNLADFPSQQALHAGLNLQPLQISCRGFLQEGESVKELLGKKFVQPRTPIGIPYEKIEAIKRLERKPALCLYVSDVLGEFSERMIITRFEYEADGHVNGVAFSLDLQQMVLAERDALEEFSRSLVGKVIGTIGLQAGVIGGGALAGALIGTFLFGPAGTVIGAAVGAALGVIGLAVNFFLGLLSPNTGSLPWQQFRTRIHDEDFDFELWWNETDSADEFGTLTLRKNKVELVTESKMVLNQDLLAQWQWNPEVRGLHIVPVAIGKPVDVITEDNIADTVVLAVFTDAPGARFIDA